MYPWSFSRSSTAAVTMSTSGCAAWKVRMPSGAASKHKKRIDLGWWAFSRATAATAEWPVASIGSTTSTSRSPMSLGTL